MQGQTAVTQKLVVYVHNFHLSLSLSFSASLPNPFWNGSDESSLHPVVWKAALS